MSEVKRYDMSGFGDGMVEREEGAFYHMDDYDALAQQLAVLQDTAVQDSANLMQQAVRIHKLEQQLAASQEKLAEYEAGFWGRATARAHIQLRARDKQLAELKQAFSESQEELVSRGKLLSDAAGWLNRVWACYGLHGSPLWKQVRAFLTTIEQDKEND